MTQISQQKQERNEILRLIIGSKVIVFLLIFLAYTYFPFNTYQYTHALRVDPDAKIALQTAYSTWDAQHYLYLSEKGYHIPQLSNAFFPLFPETIRFVSFFIRNNFLAGLLVANISAIIGCYYFYLLSAKILKTHTAAKLALVLLLVFPTAFYFSIIYSEGLFLALVAGFFYYLFSKKWLTAALFGLLLPLCRPVGIYVIIPALLTYIAENRSLRIEKNKKIVSYNLPINSSLLPVLLPIIGLGLYFLFMFITTGNPLEGIFEESLFLGAWQITNIFHPNVFIGALFTPHLVLHGFLNSAIDRLFFLFFLSCIPLVYKRINKQLFIYYILVGCVPIFGSFMAYTRYLLAAFPLFIALASFFSEKSHSKLQWSFIIICVLMQIIFTMMQSLNYWVS